jgi:hypothetical protein
MKVHCTSNCTRVNYCTNVDTCGSNCSKVRVYDCIDKYCLCNVYDNVRCSIKENSKSTSNYTWTDIITINAYNLIVKPEHINEVKEALKIESERRAYTNEEPVTNIPTYSCPSNTTVYYRDVIRSTSTILPNLDQTIINQFDSIIMNSWKNITSFMLNYMAPNSNNCVMNVSDLSNILTVLNGNIINGTSLQTIIQSIISIRSHIDDMNNRCVCNSRVVSTGCYGHYICTTNFPSHTAYDELRYTDYCYSALYCGNHRTAYWYYCTNYCGWHLGGRLCYGNCGLVCPGNSNPSYSPYITCSYHCTCNKQSSCSTVYSGSGCSRHDGGSICNKVSYVSKYCTNYSYTY